jgi:CHASE3 domain sensor protein
MATAVKMDEEAKSRLEELQAEIKLRTGRKVTQQEILSRMVDQAYESKSAFVDSFRETTVPLSDDEIERMNRETFDSGTETDEEDIDDILYG